MLNAILHSKDISVDNDSSTSYRDLYNNIEDFFTATIFTRISYLPIEVQAKIFYELIKKDDLLKIKTLVSRDFWPKWDLKGRQYVEPDVFFEYNNIDIIIEAKRNDLTFHGEEQLKNELLAYREMNLEKPMFLLAIGGGCTMSNDEENIIFVTWKSLYDVIKKIYENTNDNIFSKLIYSDLQEAFKLHGYYPYKWLSTLKYDQIKLDNTQVLKWNKI